MEIESFLREKKLEAKIFSVNWKVVELNLTKTNVLIISFALRTLFGMTSTTKTMFWGSLSLNSEPYAKNIMMV